MGRILAVFTFILLVAFIVVLIFYTPVGSYVLPKAGGGSSSSTSTTTTTTATANCVDCAYHLSLVNTSGSAGQEESFSVSGPSGTPFVLDMGNSTTTVTVMSGLLIPNTGQYNGFFTVPTGLKSGSYNIFVVEGNSVGFTLLPS